MNESVLNALMQLFALVAGIQKEEETNLNESRKIVRLYLHNYLSTDITEKYLQIYEKHLTQFASNNEKKRNKRLAASSVKILKITEKINKTLNQLEKLLVLFRVIEYVSQTDINTAERDLINTLANSFSVEQKEYENILYFSISEYNKMPIIENLTTINASKTNQQSKIKHIYEPHLDKPIDILYIKSIETFVFKYNGKQQLRITGKNISTNSINILNRGTIIRGNTIKPIYQTEIANRFLFSNTTQKIQLIANNIQFKFKNSNNGIQKVNLELESGQLIAILGGSGVGKSTLLNLLIGKYQLNSGKILINGFDINKNKKQLEGIIGFVPQDDLLIEELTVFQNLYYNAKLCFGNYNDKKIKLIVEKTLNELDLSEIQNLKIGNSLNKSISGGQRKRLNIALELIRQPTILFVDEPTSGLSSTDSEIVMELLKHQALMGKLVVVNIHQPSSDIYKLFDKIWILDKGGHIIYQGNPIDAISYFKKIGKLADHEQTECPVCGNVSPEIVLEIIEEKMVNQFGKYTTERRTTPKEWYTSFKKNLEQKINLKKLKKTKLPETKFKRPSKLNQFIIFAKRDILAKITDKQYLLINLIEPVILALILAFFSKKITQNNTYIFSQNINIPIFLFMAVVVAIFLGLTISAEEIIKDKKILEREKFLNLSRLSYLNSKIIILLILSAYQMLVFVTISCYIIKIKGMIWPFWIILFSTAATSNLIGLNISSAFKNVVTIYILIPLILVPQMLLGGAMIKFDDIHPAIANQKYVPIIGDLMITRWAYEAIAVEQFKNNKFQKLFFKLDKEKSQATYIAAYLIPELIQITQTCKENFKKPETKNETKILLKTLKNEIKKITELPEMKNLNFKYSEELNYNNFNEKTAEHTYKFLEKIKKAFNDRSNKINTLKDEKYTKLVSKYGKNEMLNMKQQYLNTNLADIVTDKMQPNMLIKYKNEIIQKKDPIYKDPISKLGRAHFFAAHKTIGKININTPLFNTIILWIFTTILFITLYFDILKKIIDHISTMKLKKNER